MFSVLIISSPAVVRSIVISVYECLFVCLFVCPLGYDKNTFEFYQLFCTCYLWPWLGPSLTAVQSIYYVLLVLCMTSCFHVQWRELARIKDEAYVSSSSPGGGTSRSSNNVTWLRLPDGGTGCEVCRLQLRLIFKSVCRIVVVWAALSVARRTTSRRKFCRRKVTAMKWIRGLSDALCQYIQHKQHFNNRTSAASTTTATTTTIARWVIGINYYLLCS